MATDPTAHLDHGDGCEWCPEDDRSALNTDHHTNTVRAVVLVGAGPNNWRLCAGCSLLPKFKRKTKRVSLAKPSRRAKPPTSEVINWKSVAKAEQSDNERLRIRITDLEAAQTLRPMADVPIGETRVLARHVALGWFSVARARDELEFRGSEGFAWHGDHFRGWIPMPVLPDESVSMEVEL